MRLMADGSALLDENDEVGEYTQENLEKMFIQMLDLGDEEMDDMMKSEPEHEKYLLPRNMLGKAAKKGAHDGNCAQLVTCMAAFVVPSRNFDDIRSKLWADLYMFFGRRGPDFDKCVVYVANIRMKEAVKIMKLFECKQLLYAKPGAIYFKSKDLFFRGYCGPDNDDGAEVDNFGRILGAPDMNKAIAVFEKTVPSYYDGRFMRARKKKRKAIHGRWCEASIEGMFAG